MANKMTNTNCCVCGEKECYSVIVEHRKHHLNEITITGRHTDYYCTIWCQKEHFYQTSLDNLTKWRTLWKEANEETRPNIHRDVLVKKWFSITLVMIYCIEALIDKDFKKADTMMEKKKSQMAETLGEIKSRHCNSYLKIMEDFVPIVGACESFKRLDDLSDSGWCE